MQVTRATFIPLLAPANSDRLDPGTVRDEYNGDLTVVYTFGPQFGRRVVTHADLEQMEIAPRVLRRSAFDHLEVLSSRAEFHGQPPALMLSFEGLESSLLLATDFWTRLQGALPGELVVGVPARDVVIVTGSQSQAGLEKARRCVERIFFAGDENLLTRSLLVRRGNTWEPFDRAPRPAGRPGFGPAHQHGVGQPPRQYQEHPSWPGERVAPMRPGGHRMPQAGRPLHAPAASGGAGLTSTGMQPVSPGRMPPAAVPLGPVSPAARPPISSPPVGPVPHQRPTRQRGHAPHPADIAQYSAVPYSAVPHSAVPYSAIPYSAMPYSAVPNSGSPYSLAPSSAPRSPMPYVESRRGPEKPSYRDDPLTTSSAALPRALYPEYAQVSAVPSASGRESGIGGGYERDNGFRRDAGFARDSGFGRDSGIGRDSGFDRDSGFGQRDDFGRDRLDARERDAYPNGSDGRDVLPQTPAYPASWGSAPSTSPARSEFRSGPRARFSR